MALVVLMPWSTTNTYAATPITLDPVSKWNVEWTKTSCMLRRAFGTAAKPSLLIFERFGPSDSFQFSVISDEFKQFQQGQDLRVKFGNGEAKRVTSAMAGKTQSGVATLFFTSLSLSTPVGEGSHAWIPAVTHATEAATTSVSIAFFGKERIFATGPLDKPFDALRQCTDDLVQFWGLDAKQQATLTKWVEPLSNPGSWVHSGDYPAAMLNVGKQALVSFRLSIDAQGTPTACEVQRSYNDKKFDELTCALIVRRARFSPALDAKGQPVPSYYLNTVRWIMG
jgi:TonB family protein